MRVRIRWVDLLRCRVPRLVIEGYTAHSLPSRRALHMAMTRGKFNTIRQWFVILIGIQLLLLTFVVPFAFACWLLSAAASVMSPHGLLISTLMFIGFVAIALTLMLAVQMPLVTSLLQPEFESAVRTIAATTCLFCGYDLHGHEHPAVCPECGNERLF